MDIKKVLEQLDELPGGERAHETEGFLRDKISETGYSLTSVSEEEYQKKRWFGR